MEFHVIFSRILIIIIRILVHWHPSILLGLSNSPLFQYKQLQDSTCEKNIFHKNREISILTIKKETARLTLLQEATERTKQGETKNNTKNEKHTVVKKKLFAQSKVNYVHTKCDLL